MPASQTTKPAGQTPKPAKSLLELCLLLTLCLLLPVQEGSRLLAEACFVCLFSCEVHCIFEQEVKERLKLALALENQLLLEFLLCPHGGIEDQLRVAFHGLLALVFSGVHLGNYDALLCKTLLLDRLGELPPLCDQRFAVATPGGVELNEDILLGVQHVLFKSIAGEDSHPILELLLRGCCALVVRLGLLRLDVSKELDGRLLHAFLQVLVSVQVLLRGVLLSFVQDGDHQFLVSPGAQDSKVCFAQLADGCGGEAPLGLCG
mmetsp:Transcript_78970/g.142473  ORF Transcript_78970/g.142473 Transcript_78970/m.142473 type:complete len:262 (+) Transcript_78970:63-848(+)